MSFDIPYGNYSLKSFINEIRSILHLRYFKVLCYFINLDVYRDKDDLNQIFTKNGFEIENYGEVERITAYRTDDNNNKVYSNYFYNLDLRSHLILIYTLEHTYEIENTIEKLFNSIPGIYYMPINFVAFNKLTNYLTKLYDDIKCTYFTAVHYPTFKTKGIHRHNIKRTIQYYGEDGFKSMEELKNYYGLLPKTIRYNIENLGVHEVNSEGKFTLRHNSSNYNSVDLFFDIINFVIEDILNYKKILDNSDYKIIPFETEDKIFYMPVSEPWILNFGSELSDDYLDVLINSLKENGFTLFNESKFTENSFVVGGTVYDEQKNNIFSIHIDNKKVIVIPYEKNIIESFMKLFEVFTDFDPESYLEGIENE